jgi:RNA polymerase sigma-70 factor (ECF subfamily)
LKNVIPLEVPFYADRSLHYRTSGESVDTAPSKTKPAEARLRALLDAEYDFVWRSLRRLGVPEADTDDAAQEVFLTLSRRLGDVEAGCERAFLFGVALRVASTRRRSRDRRPETSLDAVEEPLSEALGPEALAELSSARPLLDEALAALSMEQRAVFVLYELEELEVGAIAELLGVPRGTVSFRLSTARKAFERAAARVRAVHFKETKS